MNVSGRQFIAYILRMTCIKPHPGCNHRGTNWPIRRFDLWVLFEINILAEKDAFIQNPLNSPANLVFHMPSIKGHWKSLC